MYKTLIYLFYVFVKKEFIKLQKTKFLCINYLHTSLGLLCVWLF